MWISDYRCKVCFNMARTSNP